MKSAGLKNCVEHEERNHTIISKPQQIANKEQKLNKYQRNSLDIVDDTSYDASTKNQNEPDGTNQNIIYVNFPENYKWISTEGKRRLKKRQSSSIK